MLSPTALYNCCDVVDTIAASAGHNDSSAYQMVREVEGGLLTNDASEEEV